MQINSVFYHFAVGKVPKFLVQDQLELCLALLGSKAVLVLFKARVSKRTKSIDWF